MAGDIGDLVLRHREQREAHSTKTTGCSCGWCPSGAAGQPSFLRQFGAHLGAVMDAESRRLVAQDLRENAGPAWGGSAMWLTNGTHVAELVAEWVETP